MNGRLFAGGQPRGYDLDFLRDMGIRTILDLRGTGRRSRIEQARARALGLRYHGIPMGHFLGPTEEAMGRALDILADLESGPIYVHCRRGCDRTGTVIACYRIAHESWDAERAIQEARAHGMRITEFPKRAFIRRFFRARGTSPGSSRRATTHGVRF